MDMEEVRACRDLGLELPSDCTVEIQCYGLSATSSPTHTASATCSCCSSAAASPSVSSPGTYGTCIHACRRHISYLLLLLIPSWFLHAQINSNQQKKKICTSTTTSS
uniref:Uncharacterized protein n=1 Tax=Oryza brachyantha TaxID=4533 RepID=J3M3U1_ORYBR